MEKTQLHWKWFIRAGASLLLVLVGAVSTVLAQEACLLEPVSLSQRVAAATLIVEARVSATRSMEEASHIITLNELEVFKVFRGSLPVGALTLMTAGGTIGLKREEVTNAPKLAVGEQGLFLLEADPRHAGRYRLYAGAQGLISYDVSAGTASEPFAQYNSIEEELYAALEKRTGQSFRPVRTNAELRARASQASRLAAVPVTITSFSPAVVTAGTRTVLTITGAGFGATQAEGKVAFRNANNGGSGFTSPLAADYVSWSDTEIRVRVPAATTASGPAGSGSIQVVNAGGASATSTTSLTVNFALSNLDYEKAVYPIAMVGRNGQGGYNLQYNARFAANTQAKAAFERALATWRTGVGANSQVLTATTAINTNANDDVNVVSFDDAAELEAGTLGVTYSYYSGCSTRGGGINWVLEEVDYIYDEERNWQFTTDAPTGGQFDFETVVLHEQGHGIQLGHIIKPGAVMHYAIAPNTKNRTLNPINDVAGGNAVIDFSLTSVACGLGTYARLSASIAPLPVVLVSFDAEPTSNGVVLRWGTATEVGSAYFAVEATADPSAGHWTELTRVPAAGTSTTPKNYTYRDTRLLTAVRYYRLRQQDTDGSVHYSTVLTVTPVAGTELVAFPNPFATELQVQVPPSPAATLRFLDLAGRSVYAQQVPAAQSSVMITAPELRAGVYLLEWRSANQVKHIRVVKQ